MDFSSLNRNGDPRVFGGVAIEIVNVSDYLNKMIHSHCHSASSKDLDLGYYRNLEGVGAVES